MRIHRHIATLAATVAAIGALTPVAGALAALNRAGSAPTGSVAAHRVFAPARTYSTVDRFVPDRVWQAINDGMLTKLMRRS
jgi:hypothetical protein